MFTYCPAEAIEAAEAGRIPPVFDDVAPPRPIRLRVDCCCRELLAKVGDFFSKFLQNKRSGEGVSCLHIVLPRLLRPLRPVGYHQFLMMLLPHDQFDCVLIAVVGSY